MELRRFERLPDLRSEADSGFSTGEEETDDTRTDWTSFFGIDSSQVRIEVLLGGISIRAMSAGGNIARLEDALHQLADQSPFGWNWLLDLHGLGKINLHFLDDLLALGRQLDTRDGTLTIRGLRIPDELAIFSDLFHERCADLHIELDDRDSDTDCPGRPEPFERTQGKVVGASC